MCGSGHTELARQSAIRVARQPKVSILSTKYVAESCSYELASQLLACKVRVSRNSGAQGRKWSVCARARGDAVKRAFVMLQRFAVWIVLSGLVGACNAVCQSQRPLNAVQGAEVSAQHKRTTHPGNVASLPDAPSAAAANPTGTLAENAFEPQKALKGDSLLDAVAVAPPPNFAMVYETVPSKNESSDFLSRYLAPSLSKQNSQYRPSLNDGWIGRATEAASSILVTRDESGKLRLNTSYLVAVLTSVAAHSAERPYWARSTSAPIGDFGSTVGNDAGMNLLHEFGPQLREAVTGHMPSFVFKIQRRVAGERNPVSAR